MYKFGVLPYLNAAPLVYFLPEACSYPDLIYCKPREMFSVLASRRVDAAIVPVVDYLDTPGLEMVDGLGICADGNVESVLLQCKCPLEQVKIVNLDPASKTSNLLVKVLLKKHFCVRQEIHFRIGATEADACVVIGDRALRPEPALISYDLAGEWKSMTSLPFVFAVWAYWNDRQDSRRLSYILHAAKDAGCKAIAELAKLYAQRIGLTEAFCRHYLTSCIQYDLGSAEKSSIKLFRELSGSLKKIQKQNIREEPLKIRRIVQNEHKSRTIEPILTRLR
jgi:chorismate dehydratase